MIDVRFGTPYGAGRRAGIAGVALPVPATFHLLMPESNVRSAPSSDYGAASAAATTNRSLPERISDLCEQGLLPQQFRVSDVRQALGSTYAETYIRRALGLYCEKPDNYTYRWNKPRFRKIRHGVYELIR